MTTLEDTLGFKVGGGHVFPGLTVARGKETPCLRTVAQISGNQPRLVKGRY